MKYYPEILGQRIALLPAKYRSAEWFASLPLEIRNQFYRTIDRFGSQVAAEYLAENHGCDDSHILKPTKKQSSKFGDVGGIIYSNNMFRFFFPDGPKNHHVRGNPSQWAFVGYIDVGEDRIIKVSRDSSDVRSKLQRVAKKSIASGLSRLGISEPVIFNLALTVAEDVGEVAA